jgi:hypothetical protein
MKEFYLKIKKILILWDAPKCKKRTFPNLGEGERIYLQRTAMQPCLWCSTYQADIGKENYLFCLRLRKVYYRHNRNTSWIKEIPLKDGEFGQIARHFSLDQFR